MKTKSLSTKTRKTIFFLLLLLQFFCILVYNFLTPYLSDELLQLHDSYDSFGAILKAEWNNYLTWNGRFTVQLIMRCMLLLPKPVFNILNSLCFVALLLLMYLNIDRRKQYDFVMLSILSCFVWLFSVSFGQTILWASGACNYLWGAVIILCMVTLYRYKCSHTDSIQHPILLAIGLFFLGVASGWCNENTSGGALLILLYTFINYCRKHPKQKRHPFQFSGLIGMVIGLCFMVLAPGNSVRTLAVTESERHSGFMRYLARFLQINNNVENYLLWLLAITIIILVHQIFQKKTWNDFDAPVVFAVSSIATSYALIMTVTPMDRAYFGACVFMMISACQSISFLKEEDGFLYTLKYSASILLLFLFFFSYLDNGANLMRIKSALNKRDTYVAEQKAQGHYDLVLTEINPEFENDYTFIFKNDVDEDPESWGCQLYKRYYGLNSVVGTPFIDENE